MDVIELRGLSKPGTSLQNVDGAVRRGELFSIPDRLLGRILSLDDSDWSGEFFLGGIPVHELTAEQRRGLRREQIGVIRAEERLVPELTLFENLEVPLTFRTRRTERPARIDPILEQLGLRDLRNVLPRRLSAREGQLGKIARAVVAGPALVVAEELSRHLGAADCNRVDTLMGELLAAGSAMVLWRPAQGRAAMGVEGRTMGESSELAAEGLRSVELLIG